MKQKIVECAACGQRTTSWLPLKVCTQCGSTAVEEVDHDSVRVASAPQSIRTSREEFERDDWEDSDDWSDED
jgi:hypothetical protein